MLVLYVYSTEVNGSPGGPGGPGGPAGPGGPGTPSVALKRCTGLTVAVKGAGIVVLVAIYLVTSSLTFTLPARMVLTTPSGEVISRSHTYSPHRLAVSAAGIARSM